MPYIILKGKGRPSWKMFYLGGKSVAQRFKNSKYFLVLGSQSVVCPSLVAHCTQIKQLSLLCPWQNSNLTDTLAHQEDSGTFTGTRSMEIWIRQILPFYGIPGACRRSFTVPQLSSSRASSLPEPKFFQMNKASCKGWEEETKILTLADVSRHLIQALKPVEIRTALWSWRKISSGLGETYF